MLISFLVDWGNVRFFPCIRIDNCCNTIFIYDWERLLNRLHLNEHKINHNFNNCINPLCICSLDIESTFPYFLHCNYYNHTRISLLNDLNSIDRVLLNLSDLSLVNVFLYSGPQFHDSQNAFLFNSSIKYILTSERFSGCLFKMKIEEKYFIAFNVVITILYPFQFDFIHFQISSDLLSSN